MKNSDWFSRYDEKFMLIIKDEQKRRDYRMQLRRFRILCAVLSFVGLCMIILGFIFDQNWIVVMFIIFMGSQGMSYLDTDTKIMVINLYELLAVDQKH